MGRLKPTANALALRSAGGADRKAAATQEFRRVGSATPVMLGQAEKGHE